MRFLADMGVDVRVVVWLRQQGHDAVHLRELGMHRAPDGQMVGRALGSSSRSTSASVTSPRWPATVRRA